jgi:hypothetical protein
MAVRLVTADEQLSSRIRRWALEGTFRSWRWMDTEPFEGVLLAIATPGPLGFLAAFCEHNGREVTPLLLLKNAVPLYEVPAAIEADRVSQEGWAEIRRSVLLHNPGLGGCLELFEDRFLRFSEVGSEDTE